MQNFIKTRLLFLSLVIIFIYGCKNNNDEVLTTKIQDVDYSLLGAEIPNPQEISVMEKAYENLSSQFSQRMSFNFDLSPSHYYIKIYPKSIEETLDLQTLPDIVMWDLPLQYEVQDSIYAQQLLQNELHPLFTIIPVDYELPATITTELLAEMYIPDEDMENEYTQSQRTAFSISDIYQNKNLFLELLQLEADKIVGLHDFEESNNSARNNNQIVLAKKWHALADVDVYDDVKKRYEGLQNAEAILQRTVWRYKKKNTDYSGKVDFGSPYRDQAKYIIRFKTANFTIREGWLNTAELRSAKKRNHTYITDLRESLNEENWFHASLHNAANKYYKKYINFFSLTAPSKKLIKGIMGDGKSTHFDFRGFYGSEIHVYRNTNSGFVKNSRNLFSTVIHELTHASHFKFEYGVWALDDLRPCKQQKDYEKHIMIESWAVAVEAYCRKIEYNIGGERDNAIFFYQNKTKQQMTDFYTSLFIDLVDNYNQSLASDQRPKDRVFGYTLYMLERALDESRSLDDLKGRIRDKYDNATEDNLDELFDNFKELWLITDKEGQCK
jgi:hypothetical protein